MNKTYTFLTVAILAIIAIGGYLYPKTQEMTEQPPVGAISSPVFFDHLETRQNLTMGGQPVATSSTASTYTLTSDDLRREVSYISWNAGLNTTLTTMASTSAPFINLRVGESFTTYFYSATSTTATTITFAAGTGIDLQEDEGETVILNGLEVARLTFLKKSDTDVIMWVEAGQVGD